MQSSISAPRRNYGSRAPSIHFAQRTWTWKNKKIKTHICASELEHICVGQFIAVCLPSRSLNEKEARLGYSDIPKRWWLYTRRITANNFGWKEETCIYIQHHCDMLKYVYMDICVCVWQVALDLAMWWCMQMGGRGEHFQLIRTASWRTYSLTRLALHSLEMNFVVS